MAKIFTYPGFQHLAEKVFMNLDVEDLKMCAQINQSCKQILKNSMFWLKKFGLCFQKRAKKNGSKLFILWKILSLKQLLFLICNGLWRKNLKRWIFHGSGNLEEEEEETKTTGSNSLNQRRIPGRKLLSCLISNGILGKKPLMIFHAIPVRQSKRTLGRKYMKSVPRWCGSCLLKILK